MQSVRSLRLCDVRSNEKTIIWEFLLLSCFKYIYPERRSRVNKEERDPRSRRKEKKKTCFQEEKKYIKEKKHCIIIVYYESFMGGGGEQLPQ